MGCRILPMAAWKLISQLLLTVGASGVAAIVLTGFDHPDSCCFASARCARSAALPVRAIAVP